MEDKSYEQVVLENECWVKVCFILLGMVALEAAVILYQIISVVKIG